MNEGLMGLPFVEQADVVEMTRRCYTDTGTDIAGIAQGIDPLLTYADIEHNTPAIVDRIVKGEKQGYRAAIIGCFGDPGLIAARELASFPVIGPGEATLAVAATLGDRIVLAEPDRDSAYATARMVRAYGYEEKVVGILSLDVVGGDDYVDHSDESAGRVGRACLEAVRSLDAHVMVMGCIGFGLIIEQIRRCLKENAISIPVVEPGITAIAYAGMLLRAGYNQSRAMFSGRRCSI
jgi:allantoin racemase